MVLGAWTWLHPTCGRQRETDIRALMPSPFLPSPPPPLAVVVAAAGMCRTLAFEPAVEAPDFAAEPTVKAAEPAAEAKGGETSWPRPVEIAVPATA